MPSYKYKIFDTWYNTYVECFGTIIWYSEVQVCIVYDTLSEKFAGRYEIHKFKTKYPIVTFE